MDTNPSELIHTLRDNILVQSLINYFDVDYDKVNYCKVSIGFGYGSRDGPTKKLKTEPPFCLSYWITHSFYAKLRMEKIARDEKYEELEPFSALADYLIVKGVFKVAPTIRFTDENLMGVPSCK